MLNFDIQHVPSQPQIIRPQLVLHPQVVGYLLATEGKAAGVVSQAELVLFGQAFALEPVSAEAVDALFPEVAIAELAVALHGHHYTVGRQFQPEEARRLGLIGGGSFGGLGGLVEGVEDGGFSEEEVEAIALLLIQVCGGFHRRPEGRFKRQKRQADGHPAVSQHEV